jgi:isopenicillin N synthase-like dioxygenase
MLAVPVIDIHRSFADDDGARRAVAAEIGRACETIGFLMVTGHGVSRALVDDTDGLSREFFDLPLDEKLTIAIDPQRNWRRGYRPLGGTKLAASRGGEAPADLREQLVSGPEPVAGDPYYQTPEASRFFAANVWPARPRRLGITWSAYYGALGGLSAHLMRLFALALDLPWRFFDASVDRHITNLVSVNYPAQTREPLAGQLRAGPHTDFGSLTLLATDGTPGGLQVMGPDNAWHDVKPVPGAFIVNLGDLMAQWTNDRWRSTYHRVINPPHDVAGISRRHSLVFFHQPNHDARIACLPTCVEPGVASKYAPTTSGAHLLAQLAKIHVPVRPPEAVPV